jgi:hypothetical protein
MLVPEQLPRGHALGAVSCGRYLLTFSLLLDVLHCQFAHQAGDTPRVALGDCLNGVGEIRRHSDGDFRPRLPRAALWLGLDLWGHFDPPRCFPRAEVGARDQRIQAPRII